MIMVFDSFIFVTVIFSGNRFRSSSGGHYERRILRSPSRDTTALGGPIRGAGLSRGAPFAPLVPQVVDALPRVWPRRAVRLQSYGASSRPSHATRPGTDHRDNPTPTRSAPASGRPLSPHRSLCDSSRTSSLAHSAPAQRTHDRTRLAAVGTDPTSGAVGA